MAPVTSVRCQQLAIFNQLIEWKATGNLDYNVEYQNCGFWATKMVLDAGVNIPLQVRSWNLGAGTRGMLDKTGGSAMIYGTIKAGYVATTVASQVLDAASEVVERATDQGVLSQSTDSRTGDTQADINLVNWRFSWAH